MKSVRNNFKKLYWLVGLQGLLFGLPTVVLFTQENGLSLQQFFTLQALFSAVLFLLEIPSGYASDRWGRKRTLVLASVFLLLGVTAYAAGSNFWQFLVAEVLLAVGVSFNSGTLDAMTYDSFLQLGEEDKYEKTVSRQSFTNLTSDALAGALGAGLAFLFGLRVPMAVEVPFFVAAVFVALSLTEPKRHKPQEERHWKAMWDVLAHSLWYNVPLRSVVVLASVLSTLTLGLVWFTQPYQQQVELPLYLFGVTGAVMLLGAAFMSLAVPALKQKFDDRGLLVAVALVVVGSYVMLGLVAAQWALVWLVLGRSAWGVVRPLTSSLINRMTTSDVRATVLSLQAFGSRLLFALVGPVLGYAADVLSLQQALLLAGLVGGAAVVGVLFAMRRVWGRLPT